MRKIYRLAAILLALLLVSACAPGPLSTQVVVPTDTSLPPSPIPSTDTPLPPSPVPPTPTTATPAGLSDEQLKNAAYLIPDSQETVTLQDGRFQRQDELNPLDVYLTTTAPGDLNGDGLADAAMLLAVNRGGSGTFIYLVAVLNQAGQPALAGAVYIDDRPVTKRLEIKDGQIEYDVIVHLVNDPMVSPSLPETQMYRLEGSTLLLTRLESQTTDGQTRKIVIDSPQNGDPAGGVVQVRGSMPIGPFENNLAYRLYDAAGKEIDAQPFGVQAPDMGAPATFDNPVSLPVLPKGSVVWLELAELSMADGSPMAVTRVRMVVGEP